MNVNNFYSAIKSLQMTNKYKIKIIMNGDNDFNINHKLIEASAIAVNIPKKTFSLDDSQNIGMKYELPTNADTSNLSITFIADGNGEIINYNDNWYDYIHNENGNTYKFLEDYGATIYIELLDAGHNSVVTYKSINCYPITTSDFGLNNTPNTNLEFTVTYHCEKCTNEK